MVKISVFAIRYMENIQPFIDCYYANPNVKNAELDGNLNLTIINNYGELPQYHGITILNNVVRPDFSTGHLARNWNQCIINGFKNLNEPHVDCIILMQIDAKLCYDWYNNICSLPHDCYFMSVGRGDEMQFIKPEVIKQVGLYDERFCNIGYQEADYFLRVFIKMKNNSLILDRAHNRINDPYDGKFKEEHFIIHSISTADIEAQKRSCEYHGFSYNVFIYKWKTICANNWSDQKDIINNLQDNILEGKEFRYYPYFEKDINQNIYVL